MRRIERKEEEREREGESCTQVMRNWGCKGGVASGQEGEFTHGRLRKMFRYLLQTHTSPHSWTQAMNIFHTLS